MGGRRMKNVYCPDSVKPCPHCGGQNIEEDYNGMITSSKGIDYQCGWIECLDCKYEYSYNAKGEEVNRLRDIVYDGWNNDKGWTYK